MTESIRGHDVRLAALSLLVSIWSLAAIPVFEEMGFTEGADLALGLATVGLVSAIITGTILINWAARTERLHARATPLDAEAVPEDMAALMESRSADGRRSEEDHPIDPLSFHLGVIGIAIFVGWSFLQILIAVESITWGRLWGVELMDTCQYSLAILSRSSTKTFCPSCCLLLSGIAWNVLGFLFPCAPPDSQVLVRERYPQFRPIHGDDRDGYIAFSNDGSRQSFRCLREFRIQAIVIRADCWRWPIYSKRPTPNRSVWRAHDAHRNRELDVRLDALRASCYRPCRTPNRRVVTDIETSEKKAQIFQSLDLT